MDAGRLRQRQPDHFFDDRHHLEEGCRRKWLGAPIASICDLTSVTQDYEVHSNVTGFTIASAELASHPEGRTLDITVQEAGTTARALYILDNVYTALEYYADIQGISSLPKLNVVYSPGLKPEEWEEPAAGDCELSASPIA